VLHMRASDGYLFDLQGPAQTGAQPRDNVTLPADAEEDFPEIPGTSSKGWVFALSAIGLAIAIYVVVLVVI